MSRRRTSLVAPLAAAVACAAFAGPATAQPTDNGRAAQPSSPPSALRAPIPAPHGLVEQREAHIRIAGADRIVTPTPAPPAAPADTDSSTPWAPIIVGAALAALLALAGGGIAMTRRTRVAHTTSA